MKYLYKDQIRKIRNNLFNFISLSILVIVISLTFTSIKSSIIRLDKNYEPYLEQQNVEDFQFGLSSINIDYLGASELWYLCGELDLQFECAYGISLGTDAAYTQLNHIINQKVEEYPDLINVVVEEYLADIIEEYDFIIEERWVADVRDGDFQYRFLTLTSTINIPYKVDGEFPTEDFEIAIFPEFAEFNNINIDDTITIQGQDFTVTAFVYAPDYAFPVYYMNHMELDKETIVLANNSTLESLNTGIDKMYVAIGDLSQILDDQTYKEVQETDVSALGKNTQHIKQIKPAQANYKLATLPIEIENANIFMNAFLSMFIVFTGLLLSIFLKRYIDKNKKDIEILQSLGYSNFEISKSLMVFPLLISITSIIGWLVGLVGSSIMFESYASRYLFPKAPFEIYSSVFLISVVLVIIFINVISFVFIVSNLNRKPKTIKRIKLRIFKFTPVKTVFQTFLLLFTVSVMILFAVNANSIFSDFLEETKLGNNYEEALRLNYFQNDELDEDYQTFTRLRVKATSVNDTEVDFSFAMYGIDPDNDLKLLINNDIENNQLLNEGIIISEYLRYNENINIGDTIDFNVKGTEYSYTVVGVNNELIENNAFMLKQDLNMSYNLNNTYYNGIFTDDLLYQSTNIEARISYSNALDEIASTLKASTNIVNFILILSTIISLFMFGFIITNYLSENRLNISILKSIGYNNKEINQKYLLAIVLSFTVAFLLAIPTTKYLFDLLLRNIINQLGYILVLNISFVNIVIAFITLTAIFVTTVYMINQYYKNISIIEILKSNIK